MEFIVTSKNNLLKDYNNGFANPGAIIIISNKSDKNGADKLIKANNATHIVPDSDIICLNFDDVLSGDKNNMTDEEAKKIIEFVNRLSFKDSVDTITICCDGGVSRSASVAMFFDFELNHSIDKFLNINYSPNTHVINVLRKNFKDSKLTDNLIEELSIINLNEFKNKKLSSI